MCTQILCDKHENIRNAYQFEIVTYKNFSYVREILLINQKKKTIVIKFEYDRRESLKTK